MTPTIILPKMKYRGGRRTPIILTMTSTLTDYPKHVDGKAPKFSNKSSGNGLRPGTVKKNKGGSRLTCKHAITSHGPCGCKS